MRTEDAFNVKLGRIMSPTGTRRIVSFAGRVRRAAQKSSRSSGGRIRKSRVVPEQFLSRRVIVKFSLVKIGKLGGKTLAAHLNYVERDSAAKVNEKGTLYNQKETGLDKDEFGETFKDDRHYFKVIVSPEDGKDFDSLKINTRNIMAQMERDMGTKLEWAAADHYDTGRPHTHIIIRGKRDDGKDLVIPRQYISNGIRDVAEHLATLELGPVTQIDVAKKLALQTTQERFTSLDRDLLSASVKNIVDLSDVPKPGTEWSQRFNLWRVKHLAKMGLAEKVGWGRWQLDDNFEKTLRRMGDRGDILKAYHKAMKSNQIERPTYNDPIYDPQDRLAKPVTGRVIKSGILDDVNDRSYVVLDTTGGEAVFVETGVGKNIEDVKQGMIVRAGPQIFEPKKSDYTIAKIASERGGVYSPSAHELSDPSAREEYVQAHVRRLEAMRRAGHVERRPDGSWKIPKDYLNKARQFEKSRGYGSPVALDVVSCVSLEDLPKTIGNTWLDSELLSGESYLSPSGFGDEVEDAKLKRHQFLRSQNIIEKDGNVTKETLTILENMDLDSAGKSLSSELEKPYKRAPESGRVSGTYVQSIDRPSGKYAIVEKSKEFTLVPWRATMDRNLGKSISGIVKGQTISWTLAKGMGRNIS